MTAYLIDIFVGRMALQRKFIYNCIPYVHCFLLKLSLSIVLQVLSYHSSAPVEKAIKLKVCFTELPLLNVMESMIPPHYP